MNSLIIRNVKKIAILRAGALGDLIVILPALKAIRTAYPRAEIVLLGNPWQKKYFTRKRSVIDRVITIPVFKGIREEENETENRHVVEAFFKAMQQEHFDVAINMQGNGISANPFIRKLEATVSVGLTGSGAMSLDRNLRYYYYQSEVIRCMEVAKLIGADTWELEPHVEVLKEDKHEIAVLMQQVGEKPFVVLHPCAVDIRRMWPVENYPDVADALKEKGLEVIFTGSAEDAPVIKRIMSRMQHRAIDTCGECTLGGLTALLSRASLVVGADTGPLHLARAVHTPTVGIHWAPNLLNWGPLTRSIDYPVVSWNMQCPRCGTVPNDPYPFRPVTDCDHAVSFVKDITVEQVLQAVDAVLLRPGLTAENKNENSYVPQREHF